MNISFRQQEDKQTNILVATAGGIFVLLGTILFILFLPLIMFLRWVHGPEEPKKPFDYKKDYE